MCGKGIEITKDNQNDFPVCIAIEKSEYDTSVYFSYPATHKGLNYENTNSHLIINGELVFGLPHKAYAQDGRFWHYVSIDSKKVESLQTNIIYGKSSCPTLHSIKMSNELIIHNFYTYPGGTDGFIKCSAKNP